MEAYGRRGRFGVILPADNVVFEPEVYDLRFDGISFHTVRLLTWDRDQMPVAGVEASGVFTELGVDVVGYGCAETSFIGGEDINRTICEGVAARTSLPVVTATQAMIEALQALNVERVALAAPYRRSSADALASYLRQADISVVNAHSKDFAGDSPDGREWFATNRQPVATAHDLAVRANVPEADAVLVAGTNLPTLAVVESLEIALDKPVISTNSALIWAMLRRHGLTDASPRLGQLGRLPLALDAERSST